MVYYQRLPPLPTVFPYSEIDRQHTNVFNLYLGEAEQKLKQTSSLFDNENLHCFQSTQYFVQLLTSLAKEPQIQKGEKITSGSVHTPKLSLKKKKKPKQTLRP